MSNYTKTTNFLAKDSLPDSDTAKIIRGSEFDTEFNNLVTAVASKANTLSPVLSGIPTAPTAAMAVSNTQLATTAFVQQFIPLGIITLWYGSTGSIPSGWYLCNGSNGTPNLVDRFVVGAGSTYAVNAAGGSPNAALVSHTHTASTTVTDPGHLHAIGQSYNIAPQGSGSEIAGQSQATAVKNTQTATTGVSASTTISTAGGVSNDMNLPPYYALCYIMKL